MEQIGYQDDFGKVEYPDGFEPLIEGLPIEKQMSYFRIGNGLYTDKPLNERRNNKYDYSCLLDENKDIKSIIVRDGKIAGVMVLNVYGNVVPCMAEKCYCIRDDEEPDGSGYKSFTLYSYLVCVPREFDN